MPLADLVKETSVSQALETLHSQGKLRSRYDNFIGGKYTHLSANERDGMTRPQTRRFWAIERGREAPSIPRFPWFLGPRRRGVGPHF